MADETIPGISIPITADFSDLDRKFSDAISDAQQQSSKLASAIQDGFQPPNTDALSNAIENVGDKAASTGKAVDDLGAKIAELLSSGQAQSTSEALAMAIQQLGENSSTAATQLAPLSAAISQTNDAASTAAPQIQEVAKASQQAGESATTASGGIGSMVTSLLAIGGITLSIEALVELGKSAIEASDKLDDAAYAIGRLNKSAMDGKTEIAGLLAVAQDEGLSFPGLVTAAQHLEVLGVHGQDAIDTLQKLGNASELTGGSIDSMAQKFATMAEEGSNISARSLKTMGLTVDEIKQSMIDMGANADLVAGHWKDLWKVMDETQHADVLKGALSELDGAAKAMNDDIKGDIQRSMNEFYVTLAKLGDALGPLAQVALPYLVDALKVLVTGVDAGATSLKVLIDLFGGWLGILKDVYTGLAESGNALAKLDFSGAASAVSAAVDRVKTDMSDMSTKIQTDIKAGVDFGKQAWGVDLPDALDKTSQSAKDTSGELSNLTVTTKESKDAAKEYAQELANLNTELGKISGVLGNVSDSYDKYLQDLQDGGKTAVQQLKDIDSAIDAASTAALKLKDPAMIEGLQEWIVKLKEARDTVKEFAEEDAWNKLSGQIAGLAAKFPQQVGEMTGALKDLVTAAQKTADEVPAAFNKIDPAGLIGKWLEAQKQLDDQTQKMGDHFQQAMNKYREAVQNEVIPITATLQQRLAELDQKFKDVNGVTFTDLSNALGGLGVTVDGLTIKQKQAEDALNTIVKSGTTTLPELEQAWGKVSTVIDKLAKTDLPAAEVEWQKVIDKMIALKAPIGEILDLQAHMLQAEINDAIQTGESASAQVIALESIRLKQEQLRDSAIGWGESAVSSTKNIQDAFSSINKGLADIIVSGKDASDVFAGIWKAFQTREINVLITQFLKPLENELLNLGSSAKTGADHASAALSSIGKAAQSAKVDITDLGDGANATDGEFSDLGDGSNALSGGIDSLAGSADSATSSFTSFASSVGGLVAIFTAAFEAGKLLTGVFKDLFSGPSSLNITSYLPIAGMSGSQVSQLAASLGIDLSAGGNTGLGTQQNPGFSPGTAPDSMTTAQAISAINTQIQRLTDLQTGLNNEMVQAFAKGNIDLGNKLSADLQIVAGAIKTEQDTLASIDGSTKQSTVASDHVAASTANMVDALSHATNSIDSLKAQQAQLQNDIIVAQSQGNTALVTALQTQLGTVNSSLSTAQGILDGIRTDVGAIAPAIVSGFDTFNAGMKLLSSPGNLDNAGFDKLQADLEALRVALQSGDIAAITKATADLHAVIMQATQSPAVVAALAEMQAALLSGNMADLEKATADLKAAEAGNTDKLAAAQKEMADAIVSGNADALAKATADLDAALTDASAKQEAAVIKGMDGLSASEGEIAAAISKQQDTLSGLQAQQAQLNQDLIIAIAYGDDKLVASIETELGKVNGQITNASQTLDQLKGITQTGNTDIVTGLSGVKASADQIKTATENAQRAVDNLQAKLDDLKQQLIVAEADGNKKLVDTLNAQIGTTNSDLSTANSVLNQIQINTAAANDLLNQGITGAKATGDQQGSAVSNLQHAIEGLQAQEDDLNQQLIIALANGDTKRAGDIVAAINILKGQISADQSLLEQIAPGLSHASQLSASQITAAIASEQSTINGLNDHLADLNKQLVDAQAKNQTSLVATIQKEIGDTNAQLKTANDLLAALKGTTSTGSSSSSGATTGTSGSGGSGGAGTVGATPIANTPGQGMSAAQGGGYTPLQQPTSPYFQTGYAQPSDLVANLNAGTIANANLQNANRWAIYESAYRDYVLNIQGQGYMPPETRSFNIPVPTAMGPGTPDVNGISWLVDTGKPLGPPEPSLPYKGPTNTGSVPVSTPPPTTATTGPMTGSDSIQPGMPKFTDPLGGGVSGPPTVETGGPGGIAQDPTGRTDNSGAGGGSVSPRGSIDRGPTTPAGGTSGRGGTYTPPSGGTTPPPSTGTGGEYTPPPAGSGQTDWTPVISAISGLKTSIEAIHTDTGKLADITAAVKAAATSTDKLDTDTVGALGALQKSVDSFASDATQSASDLLGQVTDSAQNISSIYATDTGIQSAVLSLQGDISSIKSNTDGIFAEGNSIVAGLHDVDNSVISIVTAITTASADVVAALSTLDADILGGLGNVSGPIVDAISSLSGAFGGIADAIAAAIASAGAGGATASSGTDQAQLVTVQPVKTESGAPIPRVPVSNRIPSHADGGFISENELAVLHEGEYVLTADQVRELSTWGNTVGPVNKTPVQDPVSTPPRDKTPVQDPASPSSVSTPVSDAIKVLQAALQSAIDNLAVAQSTRDASKIQLAQQQVDIAQKELLQRLAVEGALKTTQDAINELTSELNDAFKSLEVAKQGGNSASILAAKKQVDDLTSQLASAKAGTTDASAPVVNAITTLQTQLDEALAALAVAVKDGDPAKIQAAQKDADDVRAKLMAATLAQASKDAIDRLRLELDDAIAALAVAVKSGDSSSILHAQKNVDDINHQILAVSMTAKSASNPTPTSPEPTSWQPGKGSSFSGYNPYSTPTDTQGGYYADGTRYDNAKPAPAVAPPSQPPPPLTPHTGVTNKTPVQDPLAVASGVTNKTPVMDPAPAYGPANKTPTIDPVFSYSIPSYDVGGDVPHDMLAQIHSGEFVIPADIAGTLRRMIQTPSYAPQSPAGGGSASGGGRVVTINAPITFNGVTNARDMARMFTDHLKTVIPGASAYSS